MAISDISFLNMSVPTEPSKFRVSTKYFSPEDLELYVESMEILSRLERERYQRKKLRKAAKRKSTEAMTRCNTPTTTSDLDTSSTETLNNYKDVVDEEEPLVKPCKKFKSEHESDSDECYYSTPYSSNNSLAQHNILHKSKSKLSTVSTNSSTSTLDSTLDVAEDILNTSETPLLKASKTSSTPARAKRAKSCKLKNDNLASPCIKLLSCRAVDEMETLKIYENERRSKQESYNCRNNRKHVWGLTLHKKSRKNVVYHVTECREEEGFLQKAMRFLTM